MRLFRLNIRIIKNTILEFETIPLGQNLENVFSIFQLLPFMSSLCGVGLILMPLKFLQAEQNAMIN